jgi:hypothetical protein
VSASSPPAEVTSEHGRPNRKRAVGADEDRGSLGVHPAEPRASRDPDLIPRDGRAVPRRVRQRPAPVHLAERIDPDRGATDRMVSARRRSPRRPVESARRRCGCRVRGEELQHPEPSVGSGGGVGRSPRGPVVAHCEVGVGADPVPWHWWPKLPRLAGPGSSARLGGWAVVVRPHPVGGDVAEAVLPRAAKRVRVGCRRAVTSSGRAPTCGW